MIWQNDDGVDLEDVVRAFLSKRGPQEIQGRRAGEDRSAEVGYDREKESCARCKRASVFRHRAKKV